MSVSIAGYIGGQGGRLSAIHVGTVIFVGARSVGADRIAQVVVPITKVLLDVHPNNVVRNPLDLTGSMGCCAALSRKRSQNVSGPNVAKMTVSHVENSIDPQVTFVGGVGLAPLNWSSPSISLASASCPSSLGSGLFDVTAQMIAVTGGGASWNFPFDIVGSSTEPLETGQAGILSIATNASDGTNFNVYAGDTIGFTVTADACGLGSYVLYDGSFGLGMGEMTTTPAFPSGTYSVSPEGPCPSSSIDLSKLLNEDNAEVVTYDEMDISIPPTGTLPCRPGYSPYQTLGL